MKDYDKCVINRVVEMDVWDFFVTVTRKDGKVRKVPYGSWNSDLAQRLRDAGCEFELPVIPSNVIKPDYGGSNIKKPKKARHKDFSVSDLTDLELVDEMIEVDDRFLENEIKASDHVKNYFKKFNYLSDKCRKAAERLVRKYGI